MSDCCILDACHNTIFSVSPRLFNYGNAFRYLLLQHAANFFSMKKFLSIFLETIKCVISRTSTRTVKYCAQKWLVKIKVFGVFSLGKKKVLLFLLGDFSCKWVAVAQDWKPKHHNNGFIFLVPRTIQEQRESSGQVWTNHSWHHEIIKD